MRSIREQMIAAARRLSSAQSERRFIQPWGGDETIGQALDGLAWHEEEHVKRIVAWRRRPG
jgi:hypothetical protein